MSEKKLLQLLQKKKGFFEAILELSEQESSLPLHEWISILEQKKILLACIEDVDLELKRFQGRFCELSHDTSIEIERIRHVIECILHLDASNQEKRKRELQ